MDQQKAIEMMGQLAIQLYLQRMGTADAREIRLLEPAERWSGFPGPVAYHFVIPNDLRAFIQYTDLTQVAN